MKKKINSEVLLWILLISELIGFPIAIVYRIKFGLHAVSLAFMVSNILIGVTSICMIYIESRVHAFSLSLMHWLFTYIFLFLAPLSQYTCDKLMYGLSAIHDLEWLVYSNVAILLWNLVWIMTRWLYRPSIADLSQAYLYKSISRFGAYITKFLALGSIALLFTVVGPEEMLFRASFYAGVAEASGTSSLMLIIRTTLRAFPIAAFAIVMSNSHTDRNVSRLGPFFWGIAATLVNFPLGAPRFWTGAVYLGSLAFIIGYRIRHRGLFALVFLSLIVFVFPLLGSLRLAGNMSDAFNLITTSSAVMQFNSGDYDAFSMIVHTLRYIVEGPGISFGRQIFGSLLFFIPRSIWPGKPIGSGHVVMQNYGFSFTNVSSPLQAEALINFGILGITIFGIATAALALRLDTMFWVRGNRKSEDALRVKLIDLLYPYWLGFVFFICRGDLLSSFAYTVGFSLAFALLARTGRRGRKKYKVGRNL